MNGYPFQFAVLRYTHDPVTQEFLNVGIVVYSAQARYLKASINLRYSRLSDAFRGIDGDDYRRVMGFLERRFAQIGADLQEPRLFGDVPTRIEVILDMVLPADDSSLVFRGFGAGFAEDLDHELEALYERLVTRYASREERPSRDDDEVWRTYRQHLEHRNILSHFQPVNLRTPHYSYRFSYAWHNERWHPIEPVSLDLVRPESIRNKTDRWVGRAVNLRDCPDLGTLYLLLGAPRDPALLQTYQEAVYNLDRNIPVKHRIVEESEAVSFSQELARMIRAHDATEE